MKQNAFCPSNPGTQDYFAMSLVHQFYNLLTLREVGTAIHTPHAAFRTTLVSVSVTVPAVQDKCCACVRVCVSVCLCAREVRVRLHLTVARPTPQP